MKCQYIYTEQGEKVLIPGCMAVAVSGCMEDCTCRSEKTFAEFEREEYNKAIKALREEIKDLESEYEKPIDWEQRRYELAKELMKGFASNPHNQCVDATTETLAQWSVGGADALIAELKKGGMK